MVPGQDVEESCVETKTNIDLEAHVRTLSRRLGVKVDANLCNPNDAMMYVEESPPRIEIAPVVNNLTYWIALHELGHCACGHTQRNGLRHYQENGVLKSEAEAWLWAFEHAKTAAPNLSMTGLPSYISAARYGLPGMAHRDAHPSGIIREWTQEEYGDINGKEVLRALELLWPTY